MGEGRQKDALRPLLTSGHHCCFTAVSVQCLQMLDLWVEFAATTGFLAAILFHSWAMILAWKRGIYLRARNNLLPTGP